MAEALTEGAVSKPLTVRVREACRLTGIGRSRLYELIAAGEIEVIKVGVITLIPVSGLEMFLQRRAGQPKLVGSTGTKGPNRRQFSAKIVA